MKHLAILLTCVPGLAVGEESFFFDYAPNAQQVNERVEGGMLHFAIPIKKLAPPQAASIYAFHSGLRPGREYQIQIKLKTDPKWDQVPMLKLGDDIIIEGIILSGPPNSVNLCHLETDDPAEIRLWCKHLQALLNLPEDKIEIDLPKAEQGGARQPATVPESKSEGEENPEPQSEARPR